jgi:hypothetical protein
MSRTCVGFAVLSVASGGPIGSVEEPSASTARQSTASTAGQSSTTGQSSTARAHSYGGHGGGGEPDPHARLLRPPGGADQARLANNGKVAGVGTLDTGANEKRAGTSAQLRG